MSLTARERVRRLYCLECGDGTHTALPATWFVENHTKRHNIADNRVAASFLVVERPTTDNTIKLDDNLSTMFTKSFLEWGGAVKAAEKYAKRAEKKESTGLTVI